MAQLKLKVAKSGLTNPQTKVMGYIARVITNGTADYEDIALDACRNTTIHKAEAKVALELCIVIVAEKLKQGYIVELGPVGKLYPSCTSTWVENADDLKLADITPSLYYRPATEIAAAVKGAVLQWSKATDADEADKETGGTPGDSAGGAGGTDGELGE